MIFRHVVTRMGAGLRVAAGQELTHFTLHPGEEVRTPLVVLQFRRGDPVDSQNTWRRWMVAHNVPRPGGQLRPMHLAGCSSHFFGEMVMADEASQFQFIDRYVEERIPINYWWMDAGWYVINASTHITQNDRPRIAMTSGGWIFSKDRNCLKEPDCGCGRSRAWANCGLSLFSLPQRRIGLV